MNRKTVLISLFFLAVCFSTSGHAILQVDANTVALFHFEENAHTTTYDETGNYRLKLDSSLMWTDQTEFGDYAINTSYGEAWDDIGDLLDSFPENGTIQFVFSPQQTVGTTHSEFGIMKKSNELDNETFQIYWPTNSDQLTIAWRTDATTTFLYSTARTWNIGEWYHLGFTWGQTGLKLFINGTEEDSDPDTTVLDDGDHEDFWLGIGFSSVEPAVFDELRISDIARTTWDLNETVVEASLNITAIDSVTLDDLEYIVYMNNVTDNYTSTLQENPAEFYYASILSGDVNVTVVAVDYYNYSQMAYINETNYTQLNYSLVEKGDNTITLTSDPSWTITLGTESTISCSAIQGTPSLTRNGVTVSNPYSAILSFGAYNFTCTVPETEDYKGGTTSNILNVGASGYGCTSRNQTFAFSKTVTKNQDLYTLNFTYLVDQGLVKEDMNDVRVIENNVTTQIDFTAGYYLFMNVTNVTGEFTVEFGNTFGNVQHYNNNGSSDGIILDVTTYDETNSYYRFTFYEEDNGIEQLPPDENSTNITLSAICSLGQTAFELDHEVTQILLPTDDTKLDEIRVDVQYSATEQYSRNIITDTSYEFFNYYLVDADLNQVAQMLLTLDDQTGICHDPEINIKKQVEEQLQTITEHYFDAESKAIVYLISGDRYQVYILCGDTEYNIGYLYVDPIDLTKTITLRSIPPLDPAEGNFSYYLSYNNVTTSFYFVAYDELGRISLTEFWVYNYSGYGDTTQIYQANSSASEMAEFTFVVPNATGKYVVKYRVHHEYFGNNTLGSEEFFDFSIRTITNPFSSFLPTGDLALPFGVLIVTFMIIIFALMPSARDSNAGMILVIFSVVVYGIIGWIEVSTVLVGIAVFILVLNKMMERKIEA